MRVRGAAAMVAVILALATIGSARPSVPARLAILSAEDRRAPTPRDLATIRAGLHAKDPETVRIAVRALGRLERPELIPEIVGLLKSSLPEIRAEAANAIGQAAQGWKQAPARNTPAIRTAGVFGRRSANLTVDTAAAAVIARLGGEAEPSVRAALCQTIGRLPYTAAAQVQRAESALIAALAHGQSIDDRLGVAQGLEALIRLHRRRSPPSADVLTSLAELARDNSGNVRDARVRRVALEALIAADAVRDNMAAGAAADPDAQVRRLAMRAAGGVERPGSAIDAEVLRRGLADPSPMVRLEALRSEHTRGSGGPEACAFATTAVNDHDEHVVLRAVDQLASCSSSADALELLERIVNDPPDGSPRGWHRPAHALVALAEAEPERAKAVLSRFVGSAIWQVRMYTARAAAILAERPTLEKLAADDDDNVCEAAIAGLSKVAARDAGALYIAALGRRGYQVVREAARALTVLSPAPDTAAPALRATLQRLNNVGDDNSRDARIAIAEALDALGARVDRPQPVRQMAITSRLTGDELRRLRSARARITIRDVGAFELALFTAEAPASVMRFARLAESGYYNGLTFHRVVPNFVIQGGSPGASEYIGDASFLRDEVGLWPHVRGAVGISTRGRDTGDAQIFIDLVDNPRLDHEYTVFAQVLSGMNVVDAILEGDIIEKVQIVP